jgi:hypothetical protein
MVERRQDARRERRRAAALHQLDQRVQVHATVMRDLARELVVKARPAQSRATPANDRRCFSARHDAFSALQVHISSVHGTS